MAYIFVTDSMGLSLFIFCGGLRKTNLFWNRMRIGRSRSAQVVDFGTNRKGVCDFLLAINSNFGPITPFLRYGDLLAENCEFALPHSHLTPSLRVNPFEFLDEFLPRKLESLGYPSVKISDPSLRRFHTMSACDRRTDGQTDIPIVASTGLA